MLDEMEHLAQEEALFRLLAHYAGPGAADRQAWQDRLMELDGAGPPDLVRLHGDLLAYDWIEQNTGATPAARPGVVSQCYRVTPAGLRAFKQMRAEARRRPGP